MTRLTIYQNDNAKLPLSLTCNPEEIKIALAEIGVFYQRWPVKPRTEQTTPDDIFMDYKAEIDQLNRQFNFNQVDVMDVHKAEVAPEIRNKFLKEHTHDDNEIRYFVDGSGLFYLHAADKVYAVGCEAGDLISVPQGMKHWFDTGSPAYFSCIRFFEKAEGWVAEYTGNTLANEFPVQENKSILQAIITDIEGTLAPIQFVKETLFPYSNEKLAAYLQQHHDKDACKVIIEAIRKGIKNPTADLATIIAQCQTWIAADQKITPLKQLQGLIWEQGYQEGAFKAPIYADAYEWLNVWFQARIPLYSYSSGSCFAQELLYRYSNFGDILPMFNGLFDTTLGPKKEKRSYQDIADQLNLPVEALLFLSDDADEIAAATAAGLKTCQILRPDYAGRLADGARANDFRAVSELFSSSLA
jgi:enolase-phosphatase E1